MRIANLMLVAGVTLALTTLGAAAQHASPDATARALPPTRNVATMSDLMVKILYPYADALFYIETRTPTSDSEWTALETQTMIFTETANLLMLPGRARDRKQWMDDAKLMLDAGAAALKAVKARDVAAIAALNDQLYTSCTSCHTHYRPGYGKRPPR
jgi:cytochrome c556